MTHIFSRFLLFFLLYGHLAVAQIPEQVSALEQKAENAKGTLKVSLLNQLAEKYQNIDPSKARETAQRALDLSKDVDFQEGEAHARKTIGVIYQLQGNYSQALEYFLSALKIYEKAKNEKGIAQTLHNVGVIYQNQQKFAEASRYYAQALQIDQKTGDKRGEAGTLNNLGDIFYQQDKLAEAIAYYQKSLKIRQDLQDESGVAVSLKNIGLVRYDESDYKQALTYFFQSLQTDEKSGNSAGTAATLDNIAETYLKLEKIDSAKIYGQRSMEIAEKIGLKREMMNASATLADIYALQGDFSKAFDYQTIRLITRDSVFSEENNKKIADLQNSYELEKKQTQIDLLHKSEQFNRLFIGALLSGLLLFGLFAVMLLVGYRQIRKANKLLTWQYAEINQQKEEITTQRDAIEEQRDALEKQNTLIEEQRHELAQKTESIESSIRYAQRIQQAMLPYEQRISESLPLNFILYRPRDVVSGDFYWFAKVPPKAVYEETNVRGQGLQQVLKGYENEKVVIAAIDCTGHGVPGAFMSMIGDSLLGQIVVDRGITRANQILEEMHKGIRKALKQDETQNRDGMDMALCVIDLTAQSLEYAGAKNSLIYIQNHTVHEIKADVHGVGGTQDIHEKDRKFKNNFLSFAESPTAIYLYSDGFQDQFGGPEGKKFMRKNMKELLLKIYHEPMTYQHDILLNAFQDWKGTHYQVDDVLVIGVRLGEKV